MLNFLKKKKIPEVFNGKVLNGVVIGYGGMGHYHADQLSKLPFLNFYGILDVDEKRNEEGRKKGVKVFKDCAEVMADSAVDLVVVVTPNDFHSEYVIAAANAGKAIVCEKPVTMNAELFLPMMEAVERNNVKFCVHQNRRWDNDYLTIKNAYDEELVGRVYNVESRISGSNGIAEDWRSIKVHGGGMLLDWGIHMIDQILQLNKAKVIAVDGNVSYRQGYDADDGFTATLYFENGDTALLEFDTNTFIELPRWRLNGEKGTITAAWSCDGNYVKFKDKVDGNILPVKIGNGISKTIAPRSKNSTIGGKITKVCAKWDSFYRHFYDYAVNNVEPFIKMSENLRVLRVVDAIFLSSETKQRINTDI